jgi:hypothetical protein
MVPVMKRSSFHSCRSTASAGTARQSPGAISLFTISRSVTSRRARRPICGRAFSNASRRGTCDPRKQPGRTASRRARSSARFGRNWSGPATATTWRCRTKGTISARSALQSAERCARSVICATCSGPQHRMQSGLRCCALRSHRHAHPHQDPQRAPVGHTNVASLASAGEATDSAETDEPWRARSGQR